MKTKAVFYHAGCPVCVDAEQGLAHSLDSNQFELEIVHLGENSNRLSEAEENGIKSVPALLIDKQAFHINFGASLSDLR
ncbi:MAG: thioredoxin family protein [marine bacterium B5-7]|nr:MAG: thioredoxin family protein [marine bacterium B5-7]